MEVVPSPHTIGDCVANENCPKEEEQKSETKEGGERDVSEGEEVNQGEDKQFKNKEFSAGIEGGDQKKVQGLI